MSEIKEIIRLHGMWLRNEDGGERADLSRANLSRANLSGADLSRANLSRANLSGADLSRANLSGAYLSRANLSGADLSGAYLSGADLSGADLSGADLSGVQGVRSASAWLEGNFEFAADGVLVYKRIGNTEYAAPGRWVIAEGSELSEVCNADRGTECGCGVNFGTRSWCNNNYTNADLWECLIRWRDLAGVTVPYHTDGKARCERLVLVRKLEDGHE